MNTYRCVRCERELLIGSHRKQDTDQPCKYCTSKARFANPLAYRSWRSMKNRCRNKNWRRYDLYGGRGIKICDRWMNFANFIDDMGERPSRLHTLDRIDGDGNYEPGNCRWATKREQRLNCSDSKRVERRIGTVVGTKKCIGVTRRSPTLYHFECTRCGNQSSYSSYRYAVKTRCAGCMEDRSDNGRLNSNQRRQHRSIHQSNC